MVLINSEYSKKKIEMQSNAILSCLLVLFHNVCCYQDNWVEHSDWSQLMGTQFISPNDESCQCQVLPTEAKSLASVEDQLALMYFRKFVNTLFNRKKLMYGETSKLYKRSLLFTLEHSELEWLDNTQDARDLDILVTQLLSKAKDVPLSADQADDNYDYSYKEMGVISLLLDIFKDVRQLLHISEVRFMSIALLTIVIGWIVHKRFGFSVIAIILGGLFLFGYFITYLECNRKLEVDAVIEVIDSHQTSADEDNKSWLPRLVGSLFKESPEALQKKKLLKSSKLQMPYCRPDHVFVMYASEMFLKQIETILEKTTHTIKNLNSGLSFPYNLIAPFALVCMIGYFMKLIFKYVISPKAWIGLVHGKSNATAANDQQQVLANSDRLSGENLKMLLNVIGTTSRVQSQQQITVPVSGVQELLEPLEAPPQTLPARDQNKTRESSESPSKENSNMINSSEDIARAAGFTVVADNEDVGHIESF